jgi:hypothetical protein
MAEKTVFITYKQGEKFFKAVLKESVYQQLKSNPTVVNVTVYPTELLMEHNYSIQTNGLSGNNKKILND